MSGEVLRILNSVESKLSFTTETWSDRHGRGFLGITAHFMSKDWEIKSITLDFIEIPGSHTAERLASAFAQSVFEKFQLQDKILGITVDNHSVNAALLQNIETTFFGNELQKH